MADDAAHHWWFVARRRILASLIKNFIRPPNNARILEIGCGTGHNLAMLSRFGHVEATELDDHAREIASAKSGVQVIEAALPDLSMVADGRYDLIALLDVLEHVRDDLGSLIAIRDCLKIDGALLVTVPANPWMWSAHDKSHHHYRRYRKREIETLARKAGLRVDLLSPFNTLLFPLIATARLFAKVTKRDLTDDAMPAPTINRLLTRLFGLEAHLIGRIPMPFGVSLVAVLRRVQA
ncbi:MAG TPA: class I SAM-dependent methyltransferase [Sphingomicrobium sp.]|nr:class I SAM-dependent methyltransferase [Sphingomicrobium sp.]